jgi:signal transduction histidine kinase
MPRLLRLRGAFGAAIGGGDQFRILWVEDVTDEEDKIAQIRKARGQAEQDLSLMRGALDLLTMPVWIRDSAHDLLWVNKAYAALLGTVVPDVIASQLEITLPQKAGTKSLKDLAAIAMAEGRAQTASSHVIAGGKRRWMEFSALPLPASHKTIGFAHDLTALEDAQGNLTRHITANKTLLEQLRTAVATFSAEQAIEFYNAAFANLWGLEEGWLNTRPKLGDILEKLRADRRLPEQADFPKYKQGWLDMFRKLIDPHEDMMYLPDGSAVRLLVLPHPMGGLMMTFEDVTSRLELESSYNTLIAVQKETLDNLAEAVVVYGGDGLLKLWNPAFAAIWDLNPEELEGQPHINKIVDKVRDLFVPDEWAATKAALISHGLSRNVLEGRMVRTDGVSLRYATQPLPDGGVMVSYYDITDSAKVEHALREKNAALETAEQLKTDFLANVSYQFRTPLNAIMGFSEILEHQYFGALNERQKEYTSGIRESGERLVSLIDDILDLSTIEAGYMELKRTDLPVAPLLQNIVDLTSAWAQKQKLTIKLYCPQNITNIYADERRIKQILLNLVRNAIHFTPENGNINISAENSGDGVKIVVQDTGIGIKPEDLSRIFLPFEKTIKGQGSGAGLGLALVKNIVELHGGSVKVDSAEGKGTTVTVHLK